MVGLGLLKMRVSILLSSLIPSPLLHFTLYCVKQTPFDSAGKHKFTKHGGSRCIMGDFAGNGHFFAMKRTGKCPSYGRSLKPSVGSHNQVWPIKCCRQDVCATFANNLGTMRSIVPANCTWNVRWDRLVLVFLQLNFICQSSHVRSSSWVHESWHDDSMIGTL